MKQLQKLATATFLGLVSAPFATTTLRADDHNVSRVLVISMDGTHALDLALWIKNNPNSALAQLSRRGINFTNANATKPSDSIPATVGIFTGASPAVGGMYYDDAYNRAWFPPGSNCLGAPGTIIDLKQGINLGLDGLSGLDPTKLPMRLVNGLCVPVFPHDMMRVNTVFEVIKAAGRRTAYSEKRPSYDLLNGPSGTGVNDLYTPEIACSPFTPPATCNNALLKLPDTEAFDELRGQSVLNEIAGQDHTGTLNVGTPAIFGMNFQSVNAAKKDSLLLKVGGYQDDIGTPNADLANALAYIDGAIGRMVAALAAQNLTATTAIIITAKHGETSLDPSKRFVESTSAIQKVLGNAGIPGIGVPPAPAPAIAKLTEKSTAYIWLKDQTQTASIVNVLTTTTSEATLNIAQILSGESLKLLFPDPLVDPAPPDIVVVPNPGTTYEPATQVLAEHGGFNENDVHVPLLVVVPSLPSTLIRAAVTTTQIAPTILNLLGIDTRQLQSVRIEGTRVLPGIPLVVGNDNSQGQNQQ